MKGPRPTGFIKHVVMSCAATQATGHADVAHKIFPNPCLCIASPDRLLWCLLKVQACHCGLLGAARGLAPPVWAHKEGRSRCGTEGMLLLSRVTWDVHLQQAQSQAVNMVTRNRLDHALMTRARVVLLLRALR